MIHEILPVGPLQCNCSIIGDPESREAIVVDPGSDADRILKTLDVHKLKTKKIVLTHGHIDHVGGAMKLKKKTGAPLLMNRSDNDLLNTLDVQAAWIGIMAPGAVKIDSDIPDGSHIEIGNRKALVIHTPGHTEGSLCLVFSAEKLLIAGDTLFARGIGRTDLPGGSYQKLLNSLQQRILPLPDDVVVIPGHGPITTIGEERIYNPFLTDLAGRHIPDK